MQSVCIVIPCYNEELRIPMQSFIDSYNSHNYFYVFVNDGSTDFTKEVLNSFRKGREDRVHVLNNKINQGKGNAIRGGVLYALTFKNFEKIGYLDADLSTPLSEISKLIDAVNEKILFVFGSRVKRLGAKIKRKWYRHLLGRIFATIASRILHLDVYDTQCGAKFFHRDLAQDIFQEKFLTKWIFDLEIFHRIKQIKGKEINKLVLEIPLEKWEDIGGSKLSVAEIFIIPFELFKLQKHISSTNKKNEITS